MDLTQLAERLKNGRLFHTYLVTGASQPLQERAGELIAQGGVCTGTPPIPCGTCRDCVKAAHGIHPDITHLRREKDAREFTVDAMRALRSAASVMPNEGRRSVYVIHQADTMNIQAQNAMLKVFEEPPAHAMFILLADNPQRLLPTVRSRCQEILLSQESSVPPAEASKQASSQLERLLSGNLMEITAAAVEMEKLGRSDFISLNDQLLGELAIRARSIPLDKLSGAAQILQTAGKYLDANVSSGHVAGLIMAGFSGLDSKNEHRP